MVLHTFPRGPQCFSYLIHELSLTRVRVLKEEPETELWCSSGLYWRCNPAQDLKEGSDGLMAQLGHRSCFTEALLEVGKERKHICCHKSKVWPVTATCTNGKQLQRGFAVWWSGWHWVWVSSKPCKGGAPLSLSPKCAGAVWHTCLLQDISQSVLKGNLCVNFTVSQRSNDLSAVWTCFTLWPQTKSQDQA